MKQPLHALIAALIMLATNGLMAAELPAQPATQAASTAATIAELLTEPAVAASSPIPTLFFSPDEIDKIHQAKAAYNGVGTAPTIDVPLEILPDFLKKEPQKKPFYPQFYLNSIVYHTPSDWTIWINGEKIIATTPTLNDLEITAVTQDIVSLVWKPVSVKEYPDIFSRLPGKGVEIDKTIGNMVFHLQPNQTFTSATLRIEEGRIAAIRVSDAAEAKTKTETPSLPAAVPTAVIPNSLVKPALPEANDSGVGGLIGAYKNLDKPRVSDNPVP